ncbi:MAG: patatin-like phospholipase family protein [Myxococcales bacterium]|nr:patatin-like phospholipase family protein [Myxococcales bacterium]
MAAASPSPVAHDPSRPIALVLSGGGARGAFQVGVYDVLLSDPRGLGHPPDVVSGTSAGAMNGALIAAGVPPRKILEFWLDLARKPPVVANDRFFRSLRSALARAALREPVRRLGRRSRELRVAAGLLLKHNPLSPSGLFAALLEFVLTARFDTVSDVLDAVDTPYLFDMGPLRERLEKAMGTSVLRSPRVRLALNVVDVATGRAVRIVSSPPDKRPDASATHYRYEPAITAEMIMASAAIPLLFNPIRLGGRDLWDGGMLVNTPIAPAVALGAARIVPVLVTPARPGTRGGTLSLGQAVERLADTFLENAYNGDRKLLLDRNALATSRCVEGYRAVELYRPIRPESSRTFNAGSYLFFERDALIARFEAGRLAARRWLAEGPRLDDPRSEP